MQEIHKQIHTKNCTWNIFYFKSMPSSNAYLIKHVDEFSPFTCIWTDEQTQGSGRFSRNWNSVAKLDLTFSLLLPLANINKKYWNNVTQLVAVAVVRSLEHINVCATIKWPNDVLIHNKKVCGILCQLCQSEKQDMVIAGIGLNVNSTLKDMQNIDQAATSVFIESNAVQDRQKILQYILSYIDEGLEYLQNDNFAYFCTILRSHLTQQTKYFTIEVGLKKHTGKIIDINDDGTLLFCCDTCGEMNVRSGELTSVRV